MQLYGKDFKVIEVLGGLTEGKKHCKIHGNNGYILDSQEKELKIPQFLNFQHHKVLFLHDSGKNIISYFSSLVRNRLFFKDRCYISDLFVSSAFWVLMDYHYLCVNPLDEKLLDQITP